MRWSSTFVLSALAACLTLEHASAESGYQTIQGTRVFTVIDHAAREATFSNECGSQTISQTDLQAGAIPNSIIPCPRPSSSKQEVDDELDFSKMTPTQHEQAAKKLFTEGKAAYDTKQYLVASDKFRDGWMHAGRAPDADGTKLGLSESARDLLCLSNLSSFQNRTYYENGTKYVSVVTPQRVREYCLLTKEGSVARTYFSRVSELNTEKDQKTTTETCNVGVGRFNKVMCVGPGDDCECMSVGNTCPYPVSVYYFVDLMRLSFKLEAGKTSINDACTTKSGQRVSYSTFRPYPGFPKPGQARPKTE